MEDLIEAIRRDHSRKLLGSKGLLDYLEKLATEAVLRLNKNNLNQTSLQLGIDPATLYRKRKRWGMK